MRFAEVKARDVYSNPADVAILQFTISGMKCSSPCAPDENDPEVDKCPVKYGDAEPVKEECIKFANSNVVRDKLGATLTK